MSYPKYLLTPSQECGIEQHDECDGYNLLWVEVGTTKVPFVTDCDCDCHEVTE